MVEWGVPRQAQRPPSETRRNPDMATTRATRTRPAKRASSKPTTGATPATTATKGRPARKAKPTSECRCGCERQVTGKFAQGHDARAYGMVLRGTLPESTIADCPGLMSKLQFARVQAEANAAKVSARKAAKADAPADEPTEPTEAPDPDGGFDDPQPEPTKRTRRRRTA